MPKPAVASKCLRLMINDIPKPLGRLIERFQNVSETFNVTFILIYSKTNTQHVTAHIRHYICAQSLDCNSGTRLPLNASNRARSITKLIE